MPENLRYKLNRIVDKLAFCVILGTVLALLFMALVIDVITLKVRRRRKRGKSR